MMVEAVALVELSFFVVLALLGTVLSIRMRQPYVVGLLVLGMLAGPNALGLISDQSLIDAFAQLGAILLLFTVGIEFSVSRMLRSGFRAVLVTFFKMSILFFFGYEVALYFGLELTTALFAGAMIAITSTAIMYKIAVERGTARDPLMPLLFSMLIVEDLVAVAALTFFSSLSGGQPTYDDKLFSVLISLGLLGAFYFFARKPAANAMVRLTTRFNEETLIFVSFTLCMVMSFVADFFGLSAAIGAFLAGSIIASLPNSRSIEKTIRPLLLTFSAFFFLSLGMLTSPAAVLGNLGLAAVLSAVFIIVCFIAVFGLLYSTGAKGNRALFGASSMVVLGEFSLIIASTATGEARSMLLSVGSFGVVATALASSILLSRQDAIERLGRSLAPAPALATARAFAEYFSGVVRDFSPNGGFWRLSNVCWQCVSARLAAIAAIVFAVVVVRLGISLAGLPPEQSVAMRFAVTAVGAVPIAYYAYMVLRDIKPVLDALSRAIARHKKNARDESIILRDIGAGALFLLLSLVTPHLVAYLQLPGFFALADELSFLIAFLFLWDLVMHANEMRKRANQG